MKSLQYSRLAIAALAIGIAEAAHKEAVQYSKQRKQFGKPISEFQAIQQYIADNETELECARLLLDSAAIKQDQGKNNRRGDRILAFEKNRILADHRPGNNVSGKTVSFCDLGQPMNVM